MSDLRRSRRQPPTHPKRQTTLIVPPTAVQPSAVQTSTSFSLFQGGDVNTASDLASSALPTQLVFDSTLPGNPLGVATTSNAATDSLLPAATTNAKSVVPTSTSPPQQTEAAFQSAQRAAIPVIPIIMAVFSTLTIIGILVLLWFLKRSRRRGRTQGRVSAEEGRGRPAGDVLRKLGTNTYEKDPFSDSHAQIDDDPFADPEKSTLHARGGSDSFLSMTPPRQPFTHAASASTGSSASGKARKREVEEARKQDMAALNNLVRALDVKDRRAEEEGRDRTSLPPVELFKAALVR